METTVPGVTLIHKHATITPVLLMARGLNGVTSQHVLKHVDMAFLLEIERASICHQVHSMVKIVQDSTPSRNSVTRMCVHKMPCGVPGENGQTAAPLVAEETRRVIVNVIGPRAYTETLVWVTVLNPRSAAQTFARLMECGRNGTTGVHAVPHVTLEECNVKETARMMTRLLMGLFVLAKTWKSSFAEMDFVQLMVYGHRGPIGAHAQ